MSLPVDCRTAASVLMVYVTLDELKEVVMFGVPGGSLLGIGALPTLTLGSDLGPAFVGMIVLAFAAAIMLSVIRKEVHEIRWPSF